MVAVRKEHFVCFFATRMMRFVLHHGLHLAARILLRIMKSLPKDLKQTELKDSYPFIQVTSLLFYSQRISKLLLTLKKLYTRALITHKVFQECEPCGDNTEPKIDIFIANILIQKAWEDVFKKILDSDLQTLASYRRQEDVVEYAEVVYNIKRGECSVLRQLLSLRTTDN